MSATAYAQLSLMLDILKNKESRIDDVVAKHNSIFGQLVLDNRSIRYQPIVEVLE
jgi:hypothetical protein